MEGVKLIIVASPFKNCFFALLAIIATAHAGTVTVQSNILGPTPTIIGYNSGHFWPGANTIDWWRYSGVSGGRIFVSPSAIEPSGRFPAIASTVTNAASFNNLKAAVRANPWSSAYLNWSYVTNQYNTSMLIGSDEVNVAYDLSAWKQLGMQALIQATASTGEFNVSNWPGQWQLWQFYYQQAFYLGYLYGVQRYQMYNEPDDGGPTGTNYLIRLQLASDAIQCGIADVNTMYGTALTPVVLAPVTAGAPTSTFASWGELVVTNRHVNFLGQSNTGFSLIQKYDYHEYGSSPPNPSTFANNLTYLQGRLASVMSPEPAYPTTISEFNVYDGSVFNGLSTTLDTPLNYSALGAIAADLIQNGIGELYCFKLSQTDGAGYLAKNGTHYVDNNNLPYNIGGITKGGEVWRLFNKAMAPGRSRLGVSPDMQTSVLNLLASYDPLAGRYYLLSVNNTTSSVPLNLNLAAWNIPTNNPVLMEVVDENYSGGGSQVASVSSAQTVGATQGSNSVWLFTIPLPAQQAPQIITASANTQVADGANRNVNYGGRTSMLVEDNSGNVSLRSAALLQFQVPAFAATNLQLALLSMTASSAAGSPSVLAYVYGITSNNWSESTVTWANAPNLAQGVLAGTNFANNFLLGAGTTAFIQGQLVAGPAASPYFIDVTSFLKNSTTTNISFLLERGVRFAGDTQDGDGVSIVSREGGAGPLLQLYFNAPPNPVVLLSPQANTNGVFSFTLSGPSGFIYDIQDSTDLVNWANVGAVDNSSGTVRVSINNGSTNVAYYYRAMMGGPD